MNKCFQLICFGLVLSMLLLIPNAGAQSAQKTLPVVEFAAIPYYPPLARAGKVEGVVHLQVTTDGHKVIATHILDGKTWLAEAAEQNAKTWQFRSHQPTSFATTYVYRLVDDLKSLQSHPKIILQLPLEVEIDEQRWPGTGDEPAKTP